MASMLFTLLVILPGVSTESISLWSSRVLTVDETTRMTVTDGVFPTIRGVATRGVASRITIVSTAAQSAVSMMFFLWWIDFTMNS